MDELMILLLACSAFTALVTEAVKKTVGDVLPSNILVAVVSVVVAGLICAGYVVYYEVALTANIRTLPMDEQRPLQNISNLNIFDCSRHINCKEE